MTTNLSRLIRKRGGIKHKMTNFLQFLQPIQTTLDKDPSNIDEKTKIQLQERTDKFGLLYDEFDDVQGEIECICDGEDLETHYNERDDFIASYSSCSADAKRILQKISLEFTDGRHDNSSNYTQGQHDSSVGHFTQNIKLPIINLVKFNGKYDSWLEFKDMYESLIHGNKSINNIQKFHYLRASLEGEPLKAIQSFDFSSENYDTAWELIRDRYDNKRFLANNHVKALFDLDVLTRESASGLRGLIDGMFRHLRALEKLKQPVQHWDIILIYLITSKLDRNTAREWEKHKIDQEFPTLNDLKVFLSKKAAFLESIDMNHSSNSKSVNRDFSKDTTKASKSVSFLSSNPKCNFCKNAHLIYKCDDFLKLSVLDRKKKVNELKLCENCLCTGHSVKNCRGGKCKVCNLKHSSFLHPESRLSDRQVTNDDSSVPLSTASFTGQNENEAVLLSTASIIVSNGQGNSCTVTSILDSGSQSNFITSALCNLKKINIDQSIIGIGGVSSKLTSQCELQIKSVSGYFTKRISCLILPTISDNLPAHRIDVSTWNIPQDINLADCHFNVPKQIDLLIGAGIFWELLLPQNINLGKNFPILQLTRLGWIISGRMNEFISRTNCIFSRNSDVHLDINRFWELEENIDANSQMSLDDIQCEDHFIKNYTRDEEGRFIVRIPFKFPPSNLGDSKAIAIKRLQSLEQKFHFNQRFKVEYSKFLKEYSDMFHMTLVNNDETSDMSYFLPHHGVIREDSLTTRLRVVFDGSSKSQSGWSLNDLQYTGPTMQNEIFSIMLRFRQHYIAVSADISKMYRQVLIHPDDRRLQRIVWRNNPCDDISVYELNTVTYGTRSAPYLAIRCLRELGSQFTDQFPIPANIINRDFYVDDLITGFTTEQEAVSVCKQVSDILESAKFSLRKWVSNSSQVLKELENENDSFSILDFSDNEQTKTLGVRWICRKDLLTFQVNSEVISNKQITKRLILSEVAKIFDPLGLVSPRIVKAKILIQKLWTLKLHWDDPVPDGLKSEWSKFSKDLSSLCQLQIKRHVLCKTAIIVELHGFCDASKEAYGACIYLRSIDVDGQIQIHLLCAKTKVAPLKSITIPRLELCSALLLSRLLKKVRSSITLEFTYHLWSDSQITLCWIHKQPNDLEIFNKHRVSEIQSLTHSNSWHYINTKDNPADLSSRGIFPSKLLNNESWWHGPSWLSLDKSQWPDFLLPLSMIHVPDMKKQVFSAIKKVDLFPFDKFSSLRKMKSIMAYILRFISNCQQKGNRSIGAFSVAELDSAMFHLIRLAQKDDFSNEIQLLSCNKRLNSTSKLLKLTPFLDNNKVLRVGGRLKNSYLEYDEKHPILLPKNHVLTKCIFEQNHMKLLHPGPQLLLSTVRQNYWPISGMNMAKKITHNCIKCFRFKPKSIDNPIMAHLPKERVIGTHPFHVTGVDYGGPFMLKDKKGRGSKTIKSYLCLFVCFSSKAVHLELATELTTECFLAAFRRFISRRGKPVKVFSDNATNFKGASRELNNFQIFLNNSKTEFLRSCANENIEWHFIPPNSPHFGGLWESSIKSAKHHLLRVIGETKFTYEEFNTVLVQIEGILNSRPLYPLSSDPNDLQPLTPAHFLIGRPLVMAPDPNLLNTSINRCSRFQLLQQIQQNFWRRWSRDYLSHLQQRLKWKEASPPMKEGSLVLIQNDNSPPCQWLLGRIEELHYGDDMVARVATIKTSSSKLKRAVSRLYPLPLPETKNTSDANDLNQ